MDITLTTPALLFPALSLLLLAYTNRFLALAALTRELYAKYEAKQSDILKQQLVSLQRRIRIIKNTQAFGVASFFGGVLCMVFLFAGLPTFAKWTFGFSLACMLISLALSLREVQLSIETLSLQLRDLEVKQK